MKQLLLISTIFLLGTLTNAQSKFEIGLSTEASWVMKEELTNEVGDVGERQNWGTAFGVYAAVPVWWRFSLSSGLNFRYAKIQRGIQVYYDEEGTRLVNGIVYDFKSHDRYYLVVPLELRLRVFRKGFISGGIEACSLLSDHEYIKNTPEYNWSMGMGSHIGKLAWSLQYLRGFNEQIVENYNSWGFRITSRSYEYQTCRMQLNLSYPLWSK
jgi:hypothetical protein